MVRDDFEGFDGIIPEQRYRNAMLYHARKQTELLEKLVEQNAQLLQRSNKTNEVNRNGPRDSKRQRSGE